MPHRCEPTARRARFFWQGVLIILPALVLAGAGLYSLRQDDALARHEAGEQAQRIAEELAERLIPEALRFEMPGVREVGRRPSVPSDEILLRVRRLPLVGTAVLTDADGQLLYPPNRRGLPLPSPLDEGELASGRQQDAWLALEAVWLGGTGDGERVLEEFLSAEPPARFAMVARFRTAMALVKAGRESPALSMLRTFREVPDEMVGESGVPLRWLAEWQLAARLSENARPGLLHGLAAQLVQEPSPVADGLLARMGPLHPEMIGWEAVQAEHVKAREWASTLEAGPRDGVIVFQGQPHLAVERPVDGGRWSVAVPLESLASEVRRMDRSMVRPGVFGVAVTVGSHALLERLPGGPALAQAVVGSLPIAVEVNLKDPLAFESQRRARTMRFAGLIAAAAAAVIVGFFAAWRAFRRQQQLSEMKSNFVSSVSHELRAPIASVRLMAEELQQGAAPSPEKLGRYLGFIGQECRRLSSVIENVLDFSRREQGREQFEFEATDLGALVEETVMLMRSYSADRRVGLECTVHGVPRLVEADGRALQRLLVNLIDNAQKHAPEGSTVVVGLTFSDSMVTLWVEDTGPGIPSEEHDRIFERFYRVGSELRRQTQGVGLGLSIVKHLAEIHGGRVRVCSRVGEGSRFTVELPLRTAALPLLAEPLPA